MQSRLPILLGFRHNKHRSLSSFSLEYYASLRMSQMSSEEAEGKDHQHCRGLERPLTVLNSATIRHHALLVAELVRNVLLVKSAPDHSRNLCGRLRGILFHPNARLLFSRRPTYSTSARAYAFQSPL